MTLTPAARLAAFVVALVAVAALAAQLHLALARADDVLTALWRMARFFTILTNGLVAVSFGLVVARGRALSATWLAGLTLWILIVGVIYHLLLAGLHSPNGLAWWTDQGLHTAVPVLAALWWFRYAPKLGLTPRHALLWLVWPLAYSAYALIRGAVGGIYPYPFLDAGKIGYGGVALNAVWMSAGFLVGGLAVVGLARRLSR